MSWKDMFLMKAEASRSVLEDPLQKFKFRVTIAGLSSGAGFEKVGGMTDEVDVVEYCEGMYEHTHKLPGREKVGAITFERGEYADDTAKNLFELTKIEPTMRQTVVVEIMNRYGDVKRTFKLAEAWVSKIEYSELDAKSSDVAIEKMTVQFEYFL